MRTIHTLPLAAVILLLAACSGGDEAAEDVAAEDAVEEVAAVAQPRPGEYRVTLDLLEFEIPGLPESAKAQAQQIYASGLTSHTFCLTPAEAENNALEQMVKKQADSDDCTTKSFDVSGGSLSSEMQCTMDGGVTSTMRMEGQFTSEGSTMTMDSTQSVPGAGETRTKVRVTSERIGDCAA